MYTPSWLTPTDGISIELVEPGGVRIAMAEGSLVEQRRERRSPMKGHRLTPTGGTLSLRQSPLDPERDELIDTVGNPDVL